MQKRVIWSSIAEEKFFLTLNFWNERNLSTEYSNKIIDATEQAEKALISYILGGFKCSPAKLLLLRPAKL